MRGAALATVRAKYPDAIWDGPWYLVEYTHYADAKPIGFMTFVWRRPYRWKRGEGVVMRGFREEHHE